MTRVLSATVMEAQTTRTRRRLSSQRNPWLKDGEADGPIKRSTSTGFIRSLLSGVCGDQLCFSMMGHLKRDARAVSPRACTVVWFFPNDTWRSAHLHPGKPAYFAPATLLFCFWVWEKCLRTVTTSLTIHRQPEPSLRHPPSIWPR